MDSTRKERLAFERAAAGADDYKTSEYCMRGKGMKWYARELRLRCSRL